MILYFSGTGNSRAVARETGRHIGDEIFDLASCGGFSHEAGRVVWVFPIYSWGLPLPVVEAINTLVLPGAGNVQHFMVATCGDDAGLADMQWRRLIKKRGWDAAGAYTVQMPNTYTMMKGFDVDSRETIAAKLGAFPARVEKIACKITAGDRGSDVVRGSFAWIKSALIYPLFMRYGLSSKPFAATSACTGCGTCARNCPTATVVMQGNRPLWNGRRCAMCERCYHACPVHAVKYGTATKGKGQYMYDAYARESGCPDVEGRLP